MSADRFRGVKVALGLSWIGFLLLLALAHFGLRDTIAGSFMAVGLGLLLGLVGVVLSLGLLGVFLAADRLGRGRDDRDGSDG